MDYLLDTNILSYILRKNLIVDNKLRQVTRNGNQVFLSCITYYEVKGNLTV